MKKLFPLLVLMLVVKMASAQDYIFKNMTDYFSITKNGQGINIFGDDIKDSHGNYFLKGNSSEDNLVRKAPEYTLVAGHYLIPVVGLDGKLFTDATLEYDHGTIKAPGVITNSVQGPGFSVGVNSTFGNIQTMSDGTGTQQLARLIFNDGLRPLCLTFFPSGLGQGLYINYYDQGTGGVKRLLTTDDLSGTGSGPIANDNNVVHLAGTETISGGKTFSADQVFKTFTLGNGGGNISSNMLFGSGYNSSTTGTFNIGIGNSGVLSALTSGFWNLALGFNTLKSTTSGQYNLAFGVNTLKLNTTGNDNIGVGRRVLENMTTGTGNVGVGALAGNLAVNGGGSFNILLGSYAGYTGNYGSGNVFIGAYAGNGNSGDNKFVLANGNLTLTNPVPLLTGDFSTGQLALPTEPAASGGTYVLLTRNSATGALESIGSGRKVIIGDSNGNIVMANKITTADGRDIFKTPGGSWKYVHVGDDGSRIVENATVTADGNGNVSVTIP